MLGGVFRSASGAPGPDRPSWGWADTQARVAAAIEVAMAHQQSVSPSAQQAVTAEISAEGRKASSAGSAAQAARKGHGDEEPKREIRFLFEQALAIDETANAHEEREARVKEQTADPEIAAENQAAALAAAHANRSARSAAKLLRQVAPSVNVQA
jgi:hypothetical protein